MLWDGTLINGAPAGYQRTVDHHEISIYFKESKFQTPGSSYLYIQKFMRRGNIRMSCGSDTYGCEIGRVPSRSQIRKLREIFLTAHRNSKNVYIDWHTGRDRLRSGNWNDYIDYLIRYRPDLASDRDHIRLYGNY